MKPIWILLCLSSFAPLIAAEATLDGHKIHYESFRQGSEAVVFIHGWTCDSTFWKAQAPVYESRRSLLIDRPGHGQSDKPEIPYTMELFARAVDAVMKDAKVDKATLVGHSMGTPVAVQFLRMHPEKVAGIMIVDGFIPEPPKDDADREKMEKQWAGVVKAYHQPDYKTFANRMIESMFTKQTDAGMREQIRTKMLSAPQYVMASAMDGMGAMAPFTESFPKLPVAAIMVKHGNSGQFQEFLKERFHLVDYEAWEGAGHFLMMEQPEKFNSALLAFLTK